MFYLAQSAWDSKKKGALHQLDRTHAGMAIYHTHHKIGD